MYYRDQMTSFGLKQIGLALCLVASLLTASPAVCACSHHLETKAPENECHAGHEMPQDVEAADIGNSVDESCICAVEQRSPYVGATSEGKELKSKDAISNAELIVRDLDFVAVNTTPPLSLGFVSDLSYSYTLRSLLPARAPPRL